jgi:hypothetical protein
LKKLSCKVNPYQKRMVWMPTTPRNSPGSFNSVTPWQPAKMCFELGGDAIRSIEYDGASKAFQIISGAPETRKKGDFKLWEWDGQASPRQKTLLDSRLKPEGITRVSMGGQNFNFIVCDGSGYFKLN